MKILRGVTTTAISVDNATANEMFPDHVVPPGTRVTAQFKKGKLVGKASAVRGEKWTTFPITRREFCTH